MRFIYEQRSPLHLGEHGNVFHGNLIRCDQDMKLRYMLLLQSDSDWFWHELLSVIELLLDKKVTRIG